MRNLELISESLVNQILGKEPNQIEFFINEAKTIGIDKLPYILEINTAPAIAIPAKEAIINPFAILFLLTVVLWIWVSVELTENNSFCSIRLSTKLFVPNIINIKALLRKPLPKFKFLPHKFGWSLSA